MKNLSIIILFIVIFISNGCYLVNKDQSGDKAIEIIKEQALHNLTSKNAKDYFTIAVLPDTQYYTEESNGMTPNGTYYKQTMDIAANAAQRNTKFVLHLGDMTDNSTDQEWQVADYAHKVFDQYSIPYCATRGNHDRHDGFNKYFGYDRFAPYLLEWNSDGTHTGWYGGGYHDGYDNDNGSYYFFESHGQKFLVISLCGKHKLQPLSEEHLNWAAEIIQEYSDRKAIVVTHSYLTDSLKYSEFGADLWNRLISRHSNIFMVVNGHDIEGDGYKFNTGIHGNSVLEVIIDYQGEGPCGNGWYKLFKFYPAENKIQMYPISVKGYTKFEDDYPATAGREIENHTYEISTDLQHLLKDLKYDELSSDIQLPGWKVVSGKFNNDEYDDLCFISTSTNGNINYVALSKGDGTFHDLINNTLSTGRWSTGWKVVSGKFNNDQYDDLSFSYTYSKGNLNYVALSKGNGRFHDLKYKKLAKGKWSTDWKVVSGKFNNDNYDDLSFTYTHDQGNKNYIAFSNGNGTFTLQKAVYIHGGNWSADWKVVSGNFNGDGYDDLSFTYTGNGFGNKNYIALSKGNGEFFELIENQLGTGNWSADWKASSGDFNGDGNDDLSFTYTGSGVGNKNFIAISKGNGKFKPLKLYWPSHINWSTTWKVVSGNFNNDDYEDLSYSYAGNGIKNYIALSNGEGN